MTRARNSANLASHGNLFVDITNDRTGIGSVVPGQSLHVAGTAGFHADTTFTGDLYNATWDRSDNSLKFVDNAKIKIGTGGDLNLYHASNNSYVDHTGIGHLFIRGNGTNGVLIRPKAGENSIVALSDAEVQLWYDNVKKFETTAYGTNTTGTAVNDGLVVAGVATVTTMNVTGVLTYDDVTSVDSVGIVTARQGVHIDDSITHIGDTNTKIRFPAADTISFETTAAERLRIHSTGDIGINYSGTPAATLDIRTNRDPSDGLMCFLRNNAQYGNGAFYGMDINSVGAFSFGMPDNTNAFVIVDGLGNSGSERLRITSDGRLLMGVDTSQQGDANLQVFRAATTSRITFGNINTSASGIAGIDFCPSNKVMGSRIECQASEDFSTSANRTADLVFFTRKDGTSSEKLRINSSGHVVPGADSSYDLGLTGTRFRNVYADTYYGDGSNLSNITSTTINNNANNRVITGSGTANTLEGESKLTFDGTNLRVDQGTASDGIVGEAYSGYFGLKHTDHTLSSEYMIISNDSNTYISASSGYGVYIRYGNNDSTNQLIVGSGNDALTWRGNKVFHAGNDGAGSGLDADTLDGVQGSSFVRSDQGDTMNGAYTINTSTDEHLILQGSSNPYIRLQEGTTDKAYWQFNSDGNVYLWNQESNTGIRLGTSLSFYDGSYRTIWNSNNDGSGSGLDADLLDGMQASQDASNATIVARNASGYIFANYFNTTSNDIGSGSGVTRFYCSGDNYIRYIDKASMRSVMNTPARSTAYAGRESDTTDQNYWIGSAGFGADNFDTTVWDYGSCFFDVWSNPSGQPSGATHWTGLQAMHYTNGSARYGMRITCGVGNPAYAYIQGRWNTTTNGWYKLWNAGNDGSGSGLDADTVDGVEGTNFVRSDTSDTVSGSPWQLTNSGTAGWGFRNLNNTGTNNYVYMAHGTHGMHIRNDSSTISTYLLDVYAANGNRFMIRGADGRGSISNYLLQSGLIHFDVKLTTGTSSGDIKFNSVQENVGNGYSTSTGRFTAPVAGVYHFAGSVLQTNSGGQFDVNLRYNNSSSTKGNSMRATFTGHSTIQISETLKMNENDYVHINVSSGSLHHDGTGNWCGFQGTLLG